MIIVWNNHEFDSLYRCKSQRTYTLGNNWLIFLFPQIWNVFHKRLIKGETNNFRGEEQMRTRKPCSDSKLQIWVQ